MSNSFDWPITPYSSPAEEQDNHESEQCVIYFRDGKKLLGTLEQFSPALLYIVFHPSKQETSQDISLDQIKFIRLVKELAIKPDLPALNERAEQVFQPSEKQSFNIIFTDNETFSGDTIGFRNLHNGLYLYMPSASGKIIRMFIPRTAIKQNQIGPLIGDALVQEKAISKEELNIALERQQTLRTQRIGDYLTEQKIVSREQLKKAISRQEKQPILKLGDALIQLKLLTPSQLETALAKQKENRKIQLGQILIDMGIIDTRTLKGALAKKLGIPYVSLANFNYDPDALKSVSPNLAQRLKVVPLCMHNNHLVIALENPLNVNVIEQLSFSIQLKTIPVMASGEEIAKAIHDCYTINTTITDKDFEFNNRDEFALYRNENSEYDIADLTHKLKDEIAPLEFIEEAAKESDSTLVQLVNKIIMDAYNAGASDIHIETNPGKNNTRIRFRKDGSLIKYTEIPASARDALISRIKIMSLLDISERRRPQDGKMDFKLYGPANIELRVATIPTNNGMEDVVMRILASAKLVDIKQLGIHPAFLKKLQKVMQSPYGLILVCGPTGSGKTTTLHSMLGYINTEDRKIWTAEDPVEITQPGLRQVQVNPKIGWTFATAIRSFLRADPDVIMVGEMRDEETAQIGIQASLTGHLVISTLHTNTAPESVTRLLDLGMDPFNFADALLCVLAQRLVKTLCNECKQHYEPGEQEIRELAIEYTEDSSLNPEQVIKEWSSEYRQNGKFQLCKAVGCSHCNNTGYAGRVGIHELMVISPAIKKLIQNRAPVHELQAIAMNEGMFTLKQDGIMKILQRLTDISQVRSVCGTF